MKRPVRVPAALYSIDSHVSSGCFYCHQFKQVWNKTKCNSTNIYLAHLDTSDSASNTILFYEYFLLLVFIVVNKNINLSIVCLNVSLIVLQHSTHVCLYCLNYLLAKGIVVDDVTNMSWVVKCKCRGVGLHRSNTCSLFVWIKHSQQMKVY
mgnify:CR=1 FL=1